MTVVQIHDARRDLGLAAERQQLAVRWRLGGGAANLFDRGTAVRRRTPDASASHQPLITVSRLLKSWATPPASWPIASIFCDCRSCASRCVRSVTSRTNQATWRVALAGEGRHRRAPSETASRRGGAPPTTGWRSGGGAVGIRRERPAPVGRRHQHRRRLPHDVARRPAEHALGGAVERLDDAGVVDGDDGVAGGVQDVWREGVCRCAAVAGAAARRRVQPATTWGSVVATAGPTSATAMAIARKLGRQRRRADTASAMAARSACACGEPSQCCASSSQ